MATATKPKNGSPPEEEEKCHDASSSPPSSATPRQRGPIRPRGRGYVPDNPVPTLRQPGRDSPRERRDDSRLSGQLQESAANSPRVEHRRPNVSRPPTLLDDEDWDKEADPNFRPKIPQPQCRAKEKRKQYRRYAPNRRPPTLRQRDIEYLPMAATSSAAGGPPTPQHADDRRLDWPQGVFNEEILDAAAAVTQHQVSRPSCGTGSTHVGEIPIDPYELFVVDDVGQKGGRLKRYLFKEFWDFDISYTKFANESFEIKDVASLLKIGDIVFATLRIHHDGKGLDNRVSSIEMPNTLNPNRLKIGGEIWNDQVIVIHGRISQRYAKTLVISTGKEGHQICAIYKKCNADQYSPEGATVLVRANRTPPGCHLMSNTAEVSFKWSAENMQICGEIMQVSGILETMRISNDECIYAIWVENFGYVLAPHSRRHAFQCYKDGKVVTQACVNLPCQNQRYITLHIED